MAVIPLAARALRRILDHVVAIGDEAEKSYLQVKSYLDLAKPEGIAKVEVSSPCRQSAAVKASQHLLPPQRTARSGRNIRMDRQRDRQWRRP